MVQNSGKLLYGYLGNSVLWLQHVYLILCELRDQKRISVLERIMEDHMPNYIIFTMWRELKKFNDQTKATYWLVTLIFLYSNCAFIVLCNYAINMLLNNTWRGLSIKKFPMDKISTTLNEYIPSVFTVKPSVHFFITSQCDPWVHFLRCSSLSC